MIIAALIAKQTPAATAIMVARTGRGMPAAIKTIVTTAPAAAKQARISLARSAWSATGATSRTDRKTARPPLISTADVQSFQVGRRRFQAAAHGNANSNCVTSSGCTSATLPKCSAIAWTPKPIRLVNQPTSHSGV